MLKRMLHWCRSHLAILIPAALVTALLLVNLSMMVDLQLRLDDLETTIGFDYAAAADDPEPPGVCGRLQAIEAELGQVNERLGQLSSTLAGIEYRLAATSRK